MDLFKNVQLKNKSLTVKDNRKFWMENREKCV